LCFIWIKDGILRDKVNLEFDECRQSLQGILDRNLDHVQHLLQLSNDSPEIQVSILRLSYDMPDKQVSISKIVT